MIGLSNQEILKGHKIKNTRNRNIILDLLREEESLTAEEIFLRLRELEESTNLSTIYRTLKTFEEKAIVTKILISQDDKARYKLNNKDHIHYLVCLSCDKKVELEDCPISGYNIILEDKTDFHIIDHQLEIHGYCPKCKKPI